MEQGSKIDFNQEIDGKQYNLFTVEYHGDGSRTLIIPDNWVDPAELDLE